MAVPSIISQILAIFSGWGDYFFQREKNKVNPVLVRQRDKAAVDAAKNKARAETAAGDTQAITLTTDAIIDSADKTIPGFQEQSQAAQRETEANDVKAKTNRLKGLILAVCILALTVGCQTAPVIAPALTWEVSILTYDGTQWTGLPKVADKGAKMIAVPDAVWSRIEDRLIEFKLLQEQGRITK